MVPHWKKVFEKERTTQDDQGAFWGAGYIWRDQRQYKMGSAHTKENCRENNQNNFESLLEGIKPMGRPRVRWEGP